MFFFFGRLETMGQVEGEDKTKSSGGGGCGRNQKRISSPPPPPFLPVRSGPNEGKGGSGEGRGIGDHQSCCQLLWGRRKAKGRGLLSAGKWERRWGCCLGSSPDFQPKERDKKWCWTRGSGSSALWAQGRRKDIKFCPPL